MVEQPNDPNQVLSRIAWGKPDSPVRPLCGLCHGPLPEVPLMLWREDGSGASFCDPCAERIMGNLVPAKS